MRSEIERLTEELEATQAELYELKRAFGAFYRPPLVLGLTATQSLILGVLRASNSWVPRDAVWALLYGDRSMPPEADTLKAHFWLLRKALRRHKITIQTVMRCGWYLDAENRNRLLKLEQESLREEPLHKIGPKHASLDARTHGFTSPPVV